jgi:aminoglycoside phosphotransferase (APT) family kinase protein
MALVPHVDDKHQKDVRDKISKLEKEGTTQAKDKLKELHNIDADGKSPIVMPTAAQTAKLNK